MQVSACACRHQSWLLRERPPALNPGLETGSLDSWHWDCCILALKCVLEFVQCKNKKFR